MNQKMKRYAITYRIPTKSTLGKRKFVEKQGFSEEHVKIEFLALHPNAIVECVLPIPGQEQPAEDCGRGRPRQ